MRVHQEVIVTSKIVEDEQIVATIESAGNEMPHWILYSEKSAEYQKLCGVPSCCIVCNYNKIPKSAVHITLRKKGSLYVANIIPLEINELSLDQYNAVVCRFVMDLRAYLKKSKISVSVTLSRPNIGLEELIPGELTRKIFQRYISQYPTRYHPLDIQRLDQFTCALVRYSRNTMDFERFERLLIEEFGWQSNDAKWCRRRVETGVEVIKEYRRF